MNYKAIKKHIIFALIILLVFSAEASTKISSIPILGIDHWIENAVGNWVIIDIRKPEEFKKGHLPNAVNVWRTDYVDTTFNYGGMKSSRESMEELLSLLGVKSTDGILLYDDRGGCESARLWWILESYGAGDVLLLDGGFQAWLDAKRRVSTGQVNIEKTAYKFPFNQTDKYLATIDDVRKAMHDTNSVTIDTRTLDEYLGNIQKNGAYRSGRIPGSIRIDWANAINYDGDKSFKTREELFKLYWSQGSLEAKDIIVYCQSGVRSAHTTFVLTQLLELENVKNYDGSWIEWSYNRELPIDSGEIIITPEVEVLAEVNYSVLFFNSFSGYWNYVWSEITFQTNPWYTNYFWWLIILSIVIWLLELAFPWRKNQPKIRTDFWIDAFYMFFNFFIFNLVIFIAFCNLTTQIVTDLFGGELPSFALINIQNYPEWTQLLIFFVATDFIQWITHVLLHRFPFLWRFHKVHHSVEQMGFAAHLRYHWMENVLYTPMKYIMVMLLGGFHPEQAFIVYYVAIAIGHLNHANVGLNYGPLKYILNNPKMHIWHHAYELPSSHSHGANFGISLSIWDYIFRTNYVPHSGRDIKLGFENIENYPKTFFKQLISGFKD